MKVKVDTSFKTSIDVGTVVIVAEILRVERGLEKAPYKDAARAIHEAVSSLNVVRER